MKTIFDTLNLPRFRECPALFLGKKDLSILQAWIDGYMDACDDAEEEKRIETPNGLPISLLRDYIACMEQTESTGGIDHILRKAADGQEDQAWGKFFAYLDSFEALRVQNVQTIQITEAMARYAEENKPVYTMNAEGKWEPFPFRGLVFRKTMLNGELCRITQERPGESQDQPFFGSVSVMTQKDVDEQLERYFGEVNWETEGKRDA